MQQGIPSGEEDAAGQALQELEVVEAEAGEKVPAGHAIHFAGSPMPPPSLYCPSAHGSQVQPLWRLIFNWHRSAANSLPAGPTIDSLHELEHPSN